MPVTSPIDCMADFVAALIRRDINAALALLTDDVAFFYSNGSALWGKEAFADAITASWKRLERYTYTTEEAVWLAESADAAAVIYAFSWSGVVDGKDVGGGGRGTRVFRWEANGWRIAHEHLSAGDWKLTDEPNADLPDVR
jgi:ketosteroid isomerase-like protein